LPRSKSLKVGAHHHPFTAHQQPLLLFLLSNFETRKALGARVIAAASPNKLEVARVTGGADVVVDYTTDGWQKYIMHITGGRGVDIVYDPVGKIKGLWPPRGGRGKEH
jgi:Zinc-binding dehydrogenase